MQEPVRVAIDGTPLLGVRTGVGNIVAATIDALAARDDVELVVYAVTRRGRAELAGMLPAGVRSATRAVPARLVRRLWQRVDRPAIETWTGRVDVVHGTNYVGPPARAPVVVSVYDLTFLERPELADPEARANTALIRRALDRGAVVHTTSDDVAARVVDAFGITTDRVVRIYPGLPTSGGGDAAAGRRAAGADRYVLFLGTIDPRKNVPALVRAFDCVAGADAELRLVLAGQPGGDSGRVADAMRAAGHRDRVLLTGYVDNTARRDLIAGSSLLAFPSHDEGFGFPPLEAMAAGVPVVAAAAGSLPEVLGDAAVLVPPDDVDALATAMQRVLGDAALRADLVVRGTNQAARYDWATTAHQLVALYAQLAGRRGSP
ncbi:MAG TPA: glycosyltransferase family 1 protein [Acidimicrobiia bacterium]